MELFFERSACEHFKDIFATLVDFESRSEIANVDLDDDDIELHLSFFAPDDTPPALLKDYPPNDNGKTTIGSFVTFRPSPSSRPELIEIEIWPPTRPMQRILFGSMQFRSSIVNALREYDGVVGEITYESLIPIDFWTRAGGRVNDDRPERNELLLESPIELIDGTKRWWKLW